MSAQLGDSTKKKHFGRVCADSETPDPEFSMFQIHLSKMVFTFAAYLLLSNFKRFRQLCIAILSFLRASILVRLKKYALCDYDGIPCEVR